MLKIKKPGFFTSIQDAGRFGFRQMGVPVAGVMDQYSASIANMLLENPEEAAVMEITMTGPTLEFDVPTYIAITGANMNPEINGQSVSNNQVHKISAGDVLSFGKLSHGFRGYLAVKHGFQSEVYMNSRSFFKPITPKTCIKDQTEIAMKAEADFEPKIASITPEPFHKEHILDVFRGPEYEILNDKHLEALFSKEFTVAKENNRMAYQLQEAISEHKVSMLTSATLPGTVQLTPAGRIIILMKDGQTTGGYPRILQLSDTAICILAQKKSGDTVKFNLH